MQYVCQIAKARIQTYTQKQQTWLHEHTSILHHTNIACLVGIVTVAVWMWQVWYVCDIPILLQLNETQRFQVTYWNYTFINTIPHRQVFLITVSLISTHCCCRHCADLCLIWASGQYFSYMILLKGVQFCNTVWIRVVWQMLSYTLLAYNFKLELPNLCFEPDENPPAVWA